VVGLQVEHLVDLGDLTGLLGDLADDSVRCALVLIKTTAGQTPQTGDRGAGRELRGEQAAGGEHDRVRGDALPLLRRGVRRDDEARIDAAIAYGKGRARMVVRRDLHSDDDVLGRSRDGQHALDEVALVPQRGVRIDAVTHRQRDLRRLPGGQDSHDPPSSHHDLPSRLHQVTTRG